jgi:hypothetical protein
MRAHFLNKFLHFQEQPFELLDIGKLLIDMLESLAFLDNIELNHRLITIDGKLLIYARLFFLSYFKFM